MPNKFKATFDFKKLSNKLTTILKDGINEIGKGVNIAIQKGIDTGKDINGNSFEPLHDSTKAFGGNKPLDRTGNMKKTSLKQATENNLIFEISMKGKNKNGKKYGAFHNTGYTIVENQFTKRFMPKAIGVKVKKREWFGLSKDMKPGGSELDKRILLIKAKIDKAWSK